MVLYICKPERNVFQVKLLLIISVLLTLGFFFLFSVTSGYIASLFQLLGFASLMLGILFNVRYSLTEFEYYVDGSFFGVRKILGNKRQEVCCVALETAIDLLPKRDYDHLPSSEKGIIKYSLNQNMKAISYVFLFEFNGKRAKIEFEPNDAFVSVLKQEIQSATHNNN